MIFPARWFMDIARDTFLKGLNPVALSGAFFALIFISFLLIRLATTKFRRNLDR